MATTRLILPGKVSPWASLNRILAGPQYRDAKFFLLLDENSFQHCLPEVITRVKAFESAEFLELPVGEACKDLAIASQVWESLLESGADRSTVIVNIGGGCVMDLGGFVAASFKRGIRYINIPTTLLGMVDAAIGGKTAVNLGGAKNQVGFFHAPAITCICPQFTNTLSDDELLNGLFELLKTLMVAHPDLYASQVADILSGNVSLSNELISECALIKQAVVKSDPTDCGVRKILNFGHTFGHAIESYSLQQGASLRHGEAVGVGICCALYLSTMKLGLDRQVYSQYREALAKLLTVPHYSLKDTEALLAFMRHDKKNTSGQILCVLLQAVGEPVIDVAVSEHELRDALLQL